GGGLGELSGPQEGAGALRHRAHPRLPPWRQFPLAQEARRRRLWVFWSCSQDRRNDGGAASVARRLHAICRRRSRMADPTLPRIRRGSARAYPSLPLLFGRLVVLAADESLRLVFRPA